MALTNAQLQQHIGALVVTGVHSGQMTRDEQLQLFSLLLSFADEYVAGASEAQLADRTEAMQTLMARAYQRMFGQLPSSSTEALHHFDAHWQGRLRASREV